MSSTSSAAGRRIIHGFKKYRGVPEYYVSKTTDVARWAPSGKRQPRKFIVISDAEKREWIAEASWFMRLFLILWLFSIRTIRWAEK